MNDHTVTMLPLTWTPRPDDVDPLLWRMCGWPGCPDGYDAVQGPSGRPGWMRQRLIQRALCPFHDPAGHRPNWRPGPTKPRGIPTCQCSWEGKEGPTLGDLINQWEQHAREVTDGR